MSALGTLSSYSTANMARIQAQLSLSPSIAETIISQPTLSAMLARQAAMPALQSLNLCKPRETMRTLQSRTLQWNCWLYPFCDNHRHLSIKRNKFRHYQFVPTFCSSAQIWFSVPEAVQFFVIFKEVLFLTKSAQHSSDSKNEAILF